MASHVLGLLLVIAGMGTVSAVYPYYGNLLGTNWGTSAELPEGIAGDVYVVDSNRIQVIGFSFNGTANDAVFLVGTNRTYAQVMAGDGTDSTALVIANPAGQFEALRSYNRENVVLSLPDGTTITDFTYIAVGRSGNKMLYIGVEIPSNIAVPAPVVIGQFVTRAHLVSSGDVTVINDRTIMIRGFSYDGFGPDAFFYVGVTDRVSRQSAPYGTIPDENGVIDTKPGRYRNKDIMLTLPDTMSATDLKWLSMYCISYSHNFGEVSFPSTLNVPPYLEPVDPGTRANMNCEPLSDDLQVSWMVTADSITIELAGRIDRNTDYMAFGLSGSDVTYRMVGSDIVVVDYKENTVPRAIDYYITDYSQCSTNGGVCPDTSSFLSSTDDITMASGEVSQGVTRVTYTRALVTGDVANGGRDKAYKTDGTLQQVVWSIGPLNSNDQAAKHYALDGRITVAKTIDFGRASVDNCPIFQPKNKVELPKFKTHHLYGREGTVFTAEIGQSASEQGYLAITGLPSWGIAWYINGLLVPVLHLKRGVSYTFRVAGGHKPSEGSRYHPFYFTDSIEGGYQQSNTGTIYQGTVNGTMVDYAIGGYCEWMLNISAEEKVYNCFKELRNDLVLSCVNDSLGYTEFVFTPTSAMPDVIYYQCYTHKNLGWKIQLYDELPTTEIVTEDCTQTTTTPGATNTSRRSRRQRLLCRSRRGRRNCRRRRGN